MTYVNHERALRWEQEGIDWRARAMQNLEQDARKALWTHDKRSESGAFEFVAMMHEDGLGTSRALLIRPLALNLGCEYRIGLPDRSCAMAFPLTVEKVGNQTPEQIVANMYTGATTPLLGELFDPSLLELEVPSP